MGCGKSSVGRELSRLLCCPFMDLDSVIEERAGRSIPEIFATDGEAAFRQMEADALFDIVVHPGQELACNGKDIQIVALGGGTVMTPECAELVHEKTLCVYLRASAETLVRNLEGEAEGRPMLASGEPLNIRIATLMAQRSDTYEKTAHIVIDTDGKSIGEIAIEITNINFFKFRKC